MLKKRGNMKNNKRKKILQIIGVGALCLPAFAYIIFQATQLRLSVVNIVVLLMCCIIVFNTFKLNNKQSKETPNKTTNNAANTASEVKGKTKESSSVSKNICAKILGVVLTVLCLCMSWLSYSKMVTKYENGQYKVYNANVIAVKDSSFSEGDYDYDGTYVTKTTIQCVVTFEYFDGEEYKTVSKTFSNTSDVPTKNLKIYVENDQVIATEYIVIAGRVLSFGLIVLALMCLFAVVFNFHFIYTFISILFTASIFIMVAPLSVYPMAMLYLGYGSIVMLLCPVGLFVYGVGVYEFISNKKQKNKIHLPTE